jgi:translation initiation factor 3 subunit D
VRPDWRRVEEVDLGKISKGTDKLSGLMNNTAPKVVEDLLWCGFLDQYNDQYDRVSTRTPAPLKRVETREFYPVTTTDDPVIEKLAIEGKGTVFATDAILAHLMTCPRSVYPWDIVVQKLPTGALFFDKRDASQFDYLTVHETSNSPPPPARDNSTEAELVNSPERLSLEATMINQNFTQQILRSSKYRTKFDLPNPFWDEDDNDGMEPASVAYRYRRFDLGDGVVLVARTELHGLAKDRQKADTSKIVTNVSANKKKKVKAANPLDDAPEGDQYMVSAGVLLFLVLDSNLFPKKSVVLMCIDVSLILLQTAFALNEYDPSYGGGSAAPPARPGAAINWREKIDSQAG